MTPRPRTANAALRRARVDYITEESVYGTVLVSGMIVAAGSYHATSMQVFLTVLTTVIVFWAAHVYAGTIAGHGVEEEGGGGLSASFQRSLRRSVGFLTSAVPPSFVLLLGGLRVVDDTVALWTALWLGVAILAVLGYIVFALRGDSWPVRIIGSITTALFGIAMIVLKAVIH
ncbi:MULTISPECIES: hypothetical protein [unclassified Leifsonia]|uniref:hypothetical protein n=1 Tax=unclassified Leifsonia TaxID=2663824 RepID=UPI000A19149C|nr:MULTISPECIES: hypothetical protein [unclassified Leifsonia]QIZ98417.1 hypothetical protein HF024_07780 [Leifsonia sp. PS1209]